MDREAWRAAIHGVAKSQELETVSIKLVKDFINEPMFVAKFPHPLNCILECVLINIVGM